jgi:capsular polysaccharide biosynthesis protein
MSDYKCEGNTLISIIIIIIIIIISTAIECPLGGSSPYTSTKQIRINIHKRNNTKNTVNTSTQFTKTTTQLSKHKSPPNLDLPDTFGCTVWHGAVRVR